MKLVLQRVKNASVSVSTDCCRQIGPGLCALVGLSKYDTEEVVHKMAIKLLAVRLFSSVEKKWDKNVINMNYELLLISQFTLNAVLKGNKPDFHQAMPHEQAKNLFELFVTTVKNNYIPERIKTGYFGEYMSIHLENDGPVTIIIDSSEKYANNASIPTERFNENLN